ncbi:MAG: pyridoxamine 5'-phosphate oxidase family protein [Bryobacteraceae bacterium]
MRPDECLDLMNTADAVYLATVDAGGQPKIRAMCNLRQEGSYPGTGRFCRAAPGFTVYMGTSLSGGKIADIRANPKAAVYYCDPKTFRGLMLAGRIEVLTDPKLRRVRWQEPWRTYHPAAPEDPDWVILRLTPESASGFSGRATFAFDPR